MESNLVYSTSTGRICPNCNQPTFLCKCKKSKKNSSYKGEVGRIRVSRETKGRKGKAVTVITGIPVDSGELLVLAKELKRLCGSGGTVKDGAIEIQGEHRDKVLLELKNRGYDAKKVGG